MGDKMILSFPVNDDQSWEAHFDPNDGLCLTYLRYGHHLLLHPSGGRLIGPHYGIRKPPLEGYPLYHGSTRHAPWKIIDSTAQSLRAEINHEALWQERKLLDWQGQKFRMTCDVHLSAHSLMIACSVVGDMDTVIGIDYPWLLPSEACYLRTNGNEEGVHTTAHATSQLIMPLSTEPWHKTLNPSKTSLGADTVLVTPHYELSVSYTSPSRENCCCIDYYPQHNHVAIQPLTAQDPLHPNLTVSSLHVVITFVELMS